MTLFELLRQRRLSGAYDTPGYPREHMRATLEDWLERDERDRGYAAGAQFDPTSFPPVWPRTRPAPSDVDRD